jgi:hypothetical protein
MKTTENKFESMSLKKFQLDSLKAGVKVEIRSTTRTTEGTDGGNATFSDPDAIILYDVED